MPKRIRIKKILVPVDFSKPAIAALRYATDLAKEHRARIEVLHVVEALSYAPMITASVDMGELREMHEAHARKELDRIAAQLRQERVRAATVIKVGRPSAAIAERAKSDGADLIVMATQGRHFVQHLLLGSVAERVVRAAPCPVLTVRAGVRPRKAVRRIVTATDFSAASAAARDYAVALARSSRAELVVLHAVEPIALAGDIYGFTTSATMYDAVEKAARQSLAGVVAELRKNRGVRVHGVLVNGAATTSIVDAAKKCRADVLVVGTHGHSGLDRMLLGSVAERVVRTSSVPVLTVRGSARA
jgi:nucleotide-binding universal stress UspA family protein